MNVNLLVLRCEGIPISKAFYEDVFGMVFQEEKHGTGPTHYSTFIGEIVLELYPKSGKDTSGLRLGLKMTKLSEIFSKLRALEIPFIERTNSIEITDPDGHVIHVSSK